MSRGRVCMYVPFLYPVVSGGKVPFAGGIEVQLSLLARGLVQRGFQVDIVTCDFGQPEELVVDGVRLLRCWRPDAGWPVIRFFHPRWSSTARALHRSDADLYVYRGAALGAGWVHDVARSRGAAFAFLVGHDHDVRASLPELRNWRDRAWYRRALRGADEIVCQTLAQQETLRREFSLPSTVIMNSVALPESTADPAREGPVVWVATYKEAKRPDWFTRFAREHPDVHCIMAGVVPVPPLSDSDYRQALAVAALCPRLEVRPTIPHEQIAGFLHDASLFAHTSPAEGFPNAFLEAWASGLPTVTTFDPDGIIERERLGAKRETYEAWASELRRFLAEPVLRREAGARARRYAETSHGTGVIHDRMAEVFDRAIAGRRGRR